MGGNAFVPRLLISSYAGFRAVDPFEPQSDIEPIEFEKFAFQTLDIKTRRTN